MLIGVTGSIPVLTTKKDFGWNRKINFLSLSIIKKKMKKEEIKVLVELLDEQLAVTNKMWDDKESHAMIIGYLQGTIKAVRGHLNNNLEK